MIFFQESWGRWVRKIFLAPETISKRFFSYKNRYIRVKISFRIDLKKLEPIRANPIIVTWCYMKYWCNMKCCCNMEVAQSNTRAKRAHFGARGAGPSAGLVA